MGASCPLFYWKGETHMSEPIMVSEVNDAIIVTAFEDYDRERLERALSAYDPANKKYSV